MPIQCSPLGTPRSSETHVFGPTKTNSFTATLSHYVAQFVAPSAAATFNYGQAFAGSGQYNFTSPNAAAADFPQGRNITQYQFIDDFSWTHGNHTFKFGENFRRYDVSDHNFFFTSTRKFTGATTSHGLPAVCPRECLPVPQGEHHPTSNVPMAFWGMGVYGQDEWKATRNLKLTLALRVERNSNPVCQTNCFSNFMGPFAHRVGFRRTAWRWHLVPCNVPYSQDITYGPAPGVSWCR